MNIRALRPTAYSSGASIVGSAQVERERKAEPKPVITSATSPLCGHRHPRSRANYQAHLLGASAGTASIRSAELAVAFGTRG